MIALIAIKATMKPIFQRFMKLESLNLAPNSLNPGTAAAKLRLVDPNLALTVYCWISIKIMTAAMSYSGKLVGSNSTEMILSSAPLATIISHIQGPKTEKPAIPADFLISANAPIPIQTIA